MLDRSGRCTADRRRDAGGAVGGHDDPGRSGALRAAADRPQVARVADLVETGEERTLDGGELVRVGVAVRLAPGEHALVVAGAGGLRQVALELDLNPGLGRLAEPRLAEPRLRPDGPLGPPELEHLAIAAAERLAKRTTPLDLLPRHRRTSRKPPGSSRTSHPSARISSRRRSARAKSFAARA